MISIIIPAYNAGDYLANTIESVFNQTYPDFELLLIDDGSTDHTHEIVQAFQSKDNRIKYYSKPNGGVSSARNLGIKKARGEYFTFLDSDDTYEPAFLEKMFCQIKQTGKLLCYCGYYQRSGGNILNSFPWGFDFQDVLRFIIEVQWISTDSWLINREFVLQHHLQFNEELSFGEDFDFFCRLIYESEGSYTFVSEYLTNYNFREGSLSYKGNLWYSYKFMWGSIEANKSFYQYIYTRQGTQAEYYLPLILQRINQMYLRYLWGTLLLGSTKDFKALYHNYRLDYTDFRLFLPLKERKYKIWKLVVTCRVARIIGKCLFKPYKYLQRKILIRKIRSAHFIFLTYL